MRKERDKALAKLAAMESQKPYITLHAEKGDYRIEWHNQWTLSEGSQPFYIRPVPAEKPAVAVPIPNKCCTHWRDDALENAAVIADRHGAEYVAQDIRNMLSAPSHSQQSDAVDLLRQIFELYEDGVRF